MLNKKYTFLLILLILFSELLHSQIVTTSARNQLPQNLITSVLAGRGVLMSNGQFNWLSGNISTDQIGTFTNGPNFTNFPFSSGIIMTTGHISVAEGPNDQTNAYMNVTQSTAIRDPDLQALVAASLRSTTVLEFDFIASSSSFEFEYVFASEEYPEYVCSQYNDVFGFFLTGLDPVTMVTTTKNIAVIPNSVSATYPNGMPVAINSLNSGVPGSSFSGSDCISLDNSSYYNDNQPGNPYIQFDGYTTALPAGASVIPCETYHMKISIANVNDNTYDSGVFLKASSFNSPEFEVNENYTIPGSSQLIEGCNDLELEIKISSPAVSDVRIDLTISGTATEGVDYETLPATVYILQGDTNVFIPITTLIDDITEGVETIIIDANMSICGITFSKTIELEIIDHTPIILASYDLPVCHVCTTLSAQVLQSSPGLPLTFHWTPNDLLDDSTAQTTSTYITESTILTVMASDSLGCTSNLATINVIVYEAPDPQFTYTPERGCAPFDVHFVSNTDPPSAALFWDFGNGETSTEENPVVTYRADGDYTVSLTATVGQNCSRTFTIQDAITQGEYPYADFTFHPGNPVNGEAVSFVNLSSGNNIISYFWDFGDGHTSTELNPYHTFYVEDDRYFNTQLVVTTNENCISKKGIPILVTDNFNFYIPTAFTPNKDNNNDIFLPFITEAGKYIFSIYTRAGECVFITNDIQEGWDGTKNGKKCPPGLYVWKVTYTRTAKPNDEYDLTGHFYLHR